MTFEQHARSFGAAVDAYENGRPGYPAAVAEWLLPARVPRALDVGAGTGKFTRTLLARADEVVAVEPDDTMRERLAAAVPAVTALPGTAESLPLPDASVDAVTLAQAWHWVDPDAGAAEIARVLRPGGVLGLAWNVRDESEEWSRRLGEIITRPEARIMDFDGPVVGPPFTEGEYRTFRWVHEQKRSAFLDMITSRSYVIVLPDAERADLVRRVEELVDTDPATAGRATIAVPYVTHVHRFVRP